MEKCAVNCVDEAGGKLSGGNSRIWDGDVQERRLGNRFGGNDLKVEGVMGRRVRFVEKGKSNVAVSTAGSVFFPAPLAILTLCRADSRVCAVSAVTYTGTTIS